MLEQFSVGALFPSLPERAVSAVEFLILLLLLMLVMNALRISGLLYSAGWHMAHRARTERRLAATLCLLVFFLSAFLTNDVVLLSAVPLTIVIGVSSRINVVRIIIFEGIAANAGSLLTPFGNPQNIYISVHYKVPIADFVWAMLPLWLVSLALLLAFVWLFCPDRPLHKIHKKGVHAGIGALGLAALGVVVIYFFGLLPSLILLPIVLGLLLATGRIGRILHYFDWKLYLLFVAIAAVTGIILGLHTASLSGPALLGAGIGLSQAVSNVPAAFILSGAADWRLLAIAVNIGGSGTLISSIATVIAYRFAKKYDNTASAWDFMKWGAAYCALVAIIMLPLLWALGWI